MSRGGGGGLFECRYFRVTDFLMKYFHGKNYEEKLRKKKKGKKRRGGRAGISGWLYDVWVRCFSCENNINFREKQVHVL